MRRAATLVAIVVLVATLAACGDDDDTAQRPSTTTTTGGDPAVTSPPPLDDPDGGPDRVEPQPGTVDPTPIPLESVEPDPTDDTRLVVQYFAGVAPCSVLDRVEVDETDTIVTVTVYVGTDPAAGRDVVCIEIAKRYETVARLDAPLGDREVVDGALDPED